MIVAAVTGNIGRDAELREVNGTSVCSFSVASNRKAKGESVTTWIGVDIWGKRGESLARHLTKGTKVAVAGELSTREHEGKTYLQLRVDQLDFMGGGGGGSRSGGQRNEAPAAQSSGGGFSDEDYGMGDGDGVPF